MKNPRTLILTGDGINCEIETAFACRLAGFEAEIRHINDLIAEKISQTDLESRFDLLVLPGGFSFGDELGSGRVLALKLIHGLKWDLEKFTQKNKLVLGICNGFQALIQMKVFGSDLSITHNQSGRFINTWVHLKVTSHGATLNPWLKELTELDLPIRHGEGRILTLNSKLESPHRHAAFEYDQDVNGSLDQIAGLTNANGKILGLMPHPEAFVRPSQHPNAASIINEEATLGLKLFQNAFSFFQERSL